MTLAVADPSGWAAVGIAGAALTWAVVTFVVTRVTQRQQGRDISNIRAAQTEALQRIADATETLGKQTSLERAHSEGAQLSARLEEKGRANFRLVVRNIGPGGAQLRDVSVPSAQSALVQPTGLSEAHPIDLLPNEEHTFILALTTGDPLPIEVQLKWLDTHGAHERIQTLMP